MGRLFDAVASILDIRQSVHDEGRAAMELEFIAMKDDDDEVYPFQLSPQTRHYGDGRPARTKPWTIDWQPMIQAMIKERHECHDPARIARKFHNTITQMILAVAERVGLPRVVLSGGCIQNTLLLEHAIARLENAGFEPYWHKVIPTNDGGIAVGQAVVACHQLKDSRPCA